MPDASGAYPSTTSDTLTLIFESGCVVFGGTSGDTICQATRSNVSSSFGNVQGVKLPGVLRNDWAGESYALDDGLTLYYVTKVAADSSVAPGILRAHRETVASDFTSLETELVATTEHPSLDNPVVTADELTLYSSTTSTMDIEHIQIATRTSVDQPFTGLTAVHELDSLGGERPSWISPDGCRLYLTRDIDGQSDIFIATRSAE